MDGIGSKSQREESLQEDVAQQQIIEDNRELQALMAVVGRESSGYVRTLQSGCSATVVIGNDIYRVYRSGRRRKLGSVASKVNVKRHTVRLAVKDSE